MKNLSIKLFVLLFFSLFLLLPYLAEAELVLPPNMLPTAPIAIPKPTAQEMDPFAKPVAETPTVSDQTPAKPVTKPAVTNSAVSAPAVTPKATPVVPQEPMTPRVYSSTLNVPLGKLGEFTVGGNILGLYLQYWYGFLIGTIGILAAIMIMAGGFIYLTSGGDKGKAGEGQKMITSAITGIVLAFGVYTILYLVNPELLKIKIPSVNPVTVDQFEAPPENKDQHPSLIDNTPGPSTPSSPQEDNRIRDIFNQNGIPVVSSGNCEICTIKKCTCVGGLTTESVNDIIALKQACQTMTPPCKIDITGATETGHHKGCNGQCIDIQRRPGQAGYASLDNYIWTNGKPVTSSQFEPIDANHPGYQIGNDLYWQENNAHWHTVHNYFAN